MCLEPSETPLTLAAQLDDSMEVIKALRNGGAHLDFRAKDGMTALHKAARARNQIALKVCLSGSCVRHAVLLSPLQLSPLELGGFFYSLSLVLLL